MEAERETAAKREQQMQKEREATAKRWQESEKEREATAKKWRESEQERERKMAWERKREEERQRDAQRKWHEEWKKASKRNRDYYYTEYDSDDELPAWASVPVSLISISPSRMTNANFFDRNIRNMQKVGVPRRNLQNADAKI